MASAYERISDNEFCERTMFLRFDVTALLERGRILPLLLHPWTTKKFNCNANFAVSKSNNLALLSPDGELSIRSIKDDKMTLKSQVRVLLDPYPELRLMEWNQLETLLFATRSTAIVDVFDSVAMFLYKIPLSVDSSGSSQTITQIRVQLRADDPDFSDDLYTLQIDGLFSCFRVGKEAYHRIFSVFLGPNPVCSMVYVEKFNILISSTEFRRPGHSVEDIDSSAFGLTIHRIMDNFPYVDCIKKSSTKKAWHERIPFMSDKKSVVISMEVSPSQSSLVAVTNNGDLIWFHLPSLRVRQFTVPVDEKAAPIQIAWISDDITKAKPEEYFDGITLDPQLNRLESCRRIRIGDPTTVFALTEQRLDNVVEAEENKPRVGTELSLVFIYYLSILLRLLKALFSSFFGGDATQDLNERIGVEQSTKLALYSTRSLTLNEYIEKSMNRFDYDGAISLAKSSGTYDLDIIYKQQWNDLKKENRSEENFEILVSLNSMSSSIQQRIHDDKWIVEECLRSESKSLQTQEKLIQLAEGIVDRLQRPTTEKRVENAAQVMKAIRKTVKYEADAVAMYLKHRKSTILEFAISIAESMELKVLKYLLDSHSKELRNYRLIFLSAIPESVNPKEWVNLLPYASNAPSGGFQLNLSNDSLPADSAKIPKRFSAFGEFLLGVAGKDERRITEEWCQNRADLMDTHSGLVDDCVLFLDSAIEHGFEGLTELRHRFALYGDFVRFSNSVALSYRQFVQSDIGFVETNISRHMSMAEVVNGMEKIVALLEFAAHGDEKKFAEHIVSLAAMHSSHSFDVLEALKTLRPEVLNRDALVKCFLCSKVSGDELTEAMRCFDLPRGLIEVVALCNDTPMPSGRAPTFAEIHSASSDSSKARDLIRHFVRTSCDRGARRLPPADEWWRDLLERTRRLRHSAFEELLSDAEILRCIAEEMLTVAVADLRSDVPPSRRAPFHLVVDISGTAASAQIPLLKQAEFEELIVQKSREAVESAMPDQADANLKRAEIALDALRTGNRPPRLIAAQRRHLDAIHKALEMGSKRMPATFTYCNKEALLAEVVAIKSNYKDAKAVTEFAKLLDLTNSNSRALAVCASTAVEKKDWSKLQSYVAELAKTTRDFPPAYEMAQRILKHENLGNEILNDTLACLVHNCPEDELDSLLGIMAKYRPKFDQEPET